MGKDRHNRRDLLKGLEKVLGKNDQCFASDIEIMWKAQKSLSDRSGEKGPCQACSGIRPQEAKNPREKGLRSA
jgi:hypothetical protein